MALEADSLHLKTDVYAALGVAIGLFLVLITGRSGTCDSWRTEARPGTRFYTQPRQRAH